MGGLGLGRGEDMRGQVGDGGGEGVQKKMTGNGEGHIRVR